MAIMEYTVHNRQMRVKRLCHRLHRSLLLYVRVRTACTRKTELETSFGSVVAVPRRRFFLFPRYFDKHAVRDAMHRY